MPSRYGCAPWTGLLFAVPLLVSACIAESTEGFAQDDPFGGTFSIEVVSSELIPTVANVSWTLRAGDVEAAFVEYGLDGEFHHRAPAASDGDEFKCSLIGLKHDSEYTLRATVDAAEGSFASATESFVTGTLPASFPDTDVTFEDNPQQVGGYLLTTVISEIATPVIFDREGDVVWYYYPPGGMGGDNRAALSRDRRSVIRLHKSDTSGDQSHGQMLARIALDGSGEEKIEADGAHHDFVELPDGRLAYLAVDIRSVDGVFELVQGDRIMEVSPDGSDIRQVWSVWDDFDFLGSVGSPEEVIDWSHANAIDFYPEIDAYAVSLLNLGVIVVVDRETGELMWQLGGDDSDFTLEPSSDARQFGFQHQFELLGNSLLVFDNGSPQEYHSLAVEYALDLEAASAERTWSYSMDPPVYCPCLGDVHRFPNGNTLVTWSTAGVIEEVSPQGEVAWRLGVEMGTGFGYTTFIDDLYTSLDGATSGITP